MSFLVRAPFAAQILPLSDVPDPVFASGVVGDGSALLPNADASCVTVRSPTAGVVTKLKSHAVIVTSTHGVSILIHLGIDTVGLRGKGFAPLVDEGDIVEVGRPLIHWDLMPVQEAYLSPCVPVIVVNPSGMQVCQEYDEDAASVDALAPLFSIPDGE